MLTKFKTKVSVLALLGNEIFVTLAATIRSASVLRRKVISLSFVPSSELKARE